MAESDLYIPVRDWLVAQGYRVHVEMFDCDVIGEKDGRLVVVELKPCLTEGLYAQLRNRAGWADEVWAAIASEPRATGRLKSEGFGLLQVRDGAVRKKVTAKPQPYFRHKQRVYRLKRLTNRPPAMPHERAGMRACAELAQQRRARGTP